MHKILTAIGAAAIAIGIGFTAAVPATAAPLMPVQIETKSDVQTVDHRGYWHRRQYYRNGYERREHRNYGYRRHHQRGDYWEGINGRRGYGQHRRHGFYPRFGIYFD